MTDTKTTQNLKWLKDCEICNTGLCNQIQEYTAKGLSVREAAKKMEAECDGLWSADKIRDRYRYYAKGQYGGGTPPKNNQMMRFFSVRKN